MTLRITECPRGLYGEDCRYICQECIDDHVCDSVTGQCINGFKLKMNYSHEAIGKWAFYSNKQHMNTKTKNRKRPMFYRMKKTMFYGMIFLYSDQFLIL